jgi:hypothetical protein
MLRASAQKKPFVMFWATGAMHGPLQAPHDWRERFRGKFDMGCDKACEATLGKQIKVGFVLKGTEVEKRALGAAADVFAAEGPDFDSAAPRLRAVLEISLDKVRPPSYKEGVLFFSRREGLRLDRDTHTHLTSILSERLCAASRERRGTS